jgi:general secretion pathway protein I
MRNLNNSILHSRAAFTLLEVLVAMAILAIALTTLFGAQSHSLIFATEAKFNTNASLLGGLKLAELESGRIEPVDADGDFGKEFPGYTWKINVQDPPVDLSEWFGIERGRLRPIDLIIVRGRDPYLYKARYYIRIRDAL